MEDLKERYYSIARKLLEAREANDAMLTNHVLIKYPYNAQVSGVSEGRGAGKGGRWGESPGG